jgi:hypothetical protein
MDLLGQFDNLFALYPGAHPELQAGVMHGVELGLILARDITPEHPVRKRSKANGVPMTGFEVPPHG